MRPADRIDLFQESVIREMTRVAMVHDAVNLSQGLPDFDPPGEVLDAAVAALRSGENQYTVTWGWPPLRAALAEKYSAALGWGVDPEVHVTITCGVTEAIVVAQMAVLNRGDEILILEPAHENFRPAALMIDAVPVGIPLEPPAYRLDPERLAAAVTPRTRALLLNTPHNPTGRVFDAAEMAAVADLVVRHDLVLITDEIYDRILYDGRVHLSPGGMEALRARTLTCAGFSKTYAVTGWRLGFVIAPTALASAVRRVHDYLTICAPTPLQAAACAALALPESYYTAMLADYHRRRAVMLDALHETGFAAGMPQGAYYVMAGFDGLPIPQAAWDSTRFAYWMAEEIGVAVVPGVNFYSAPGFGEREVRFAFPKRLETLEEAARRLARLRGG